jgi:hypothetical protein
MRWLRGAPELRYALIVSWVLVIARSVTFTLFEHAHFDSDQAIVGLMAKHLSEGRAFPLFFYGQPYMLAVEAWLAVPFFWIGGPTVASLRALLIVMNLGIVSMLIVGLHRWGGLRPWHALAAALFVVLPSPRTASELLEAQGGNIEPFVWILVLWFVRDRPFWFGSLLAVGFLNREFAIYAVPVLIAGQLLSGSLFQKETVRAWLFSLVAFLAVWQGVQALVPVSSPMGPGTHASAAAPGKSQLDNLSQRMTLDVRGLAARVVNVVTSGAGGLLNARRREDAGGGHRGLGYVLGFALIVGFVRIVMIVIRRRPMPDVPFTWFVLGVGVVAALAYAVTRPGSDVTERYILLTLFIPVGVTALWLSLETNGPIRGAVIGVAILCAMSAGLDHWRQFDSYRSGHVPNPIRELGTALQARGISIAEAQYWRAYKLTFMTGERVRVASTDVARITEYQTLAQSAGDTLVRIAEEPCEGGEKLGDFYLCRR